MIYFYLCVLFQQKGVQMLYIIGIYFCLLLIVSRLTTKNKSNDSFFLGNKRSPWYVIAFGMIGSSISGVTFVSVPGMVREFDMTYLQLVLGFPIGYLIIAYLLLPLYYRLNLVSIYTYLERRIGTHAYKTGASFFFLSKIIGAAARLYLVTIILQTFVLDALGVPYWITVCISVAMIWVYTHASGIRTIIWMNFLQTFFLLLMLVLIIAGVINKMDLSLGTAFSMIASDSHSRIFEFGDWSSRQYFFKQFISGIFITIVMSGLDQGMMQKNLSCKNLKEAQKNMCWYGFSFIPLNFLFLTLGVLMLHFAQHQQVTLPAVSDEILPLFCTTYLGQPILVFFTIGVIAASFSAADSALTSLTTSACIDLIGIKKYPEEQAQKIRKRTHWMISAVFILIILIFRAVNDRSVIDAIYMIASFTYGPLLGLYAFGLFTTFCPRDRWVPFIAISGPLLCMILKSGVEATTSYRFGYELLMVNGLIVFVGLVLFSKKGEIWK